MYRLLIHTPLLIITPLCLKYQLPPFQSGVNNFCRCILFCHIFCPLLVYIVKNMHKEKSYILPHSCRINPLTMKCWRWSVDDEAVDYEAVDYEAVDDEAVGDEAVGDDAVDNESRFDRRDLFLLGVYIQIVGTFCLVGSRPRSGVKNRRRWVNRYYITSKLGQGCNFGCMYQYPIYRRQMWTWAILVDYVCSSEIQIGAEIAWSADQIWHPPNCDWLLTISFVTIMSNTCPEVFLIYASTRGRVTEAMSFL